MLPLNITLPLEMIDRHGFSVQSCFSVLCIRDCCFRHHSAQGVDRHRWSLYAGFTRLCTCGCCLRHNTAFGGCRYGWSLFETLRCVWRRWSRVVVSAQVSLCCTFGIAVSDLTLTLKAVIITRGPFLEVSLCCIFMFTLPLKAVVTGGRFIQVSLYCMGLFPDT